MTAHSFSRRILLVAAILVGLALSPRAEARVRPQEPGVSAGRLRLGHHGTSALELFRPLLQSLWGEAGSSMDPLGNH